MSGIDILKKIPVGWRNRGFGAPRTICQLLEGEQPPHGTQENQDWFVRLRRIERQLKRDQKNIDGLLTEREGNRRYYWWDSQTFKDAWLARDAHYSKGISRQVSFTLLDRYLKPLLPPDVAQDVEALIDTSRANLSGGSDPVARRYQSLDDKIELQHLPLPMQSVSLDPDLRIKVFNAVFDRRVIQAHYTSNFDEQGWSGLLTLSLQKLVFKYNHLKVMAYNHANQQTRELTTSKLSEVVMLDRVPFVTSNMPTDTVQVVLRTDSRYFYDSYFKSVRISDDQTITRDPATGQWLIGFSLPFKSMPDGTGPDYFDLASQLSAWADQIEVVSPPALRTEMIRRIRRMNSRYGLAEVNASIVTA
ncbi:MAG: WYL domain-containing protein [Oceanospirillaceae bacterium]|nr:WYL domain-containing protein [Oceanospirillaceae bacterium]